MIPRTEFYQALSLAVAAASLPREGEYPLSGIGKPDTSLETVCFDFWPNNSLRIVGTNGRRLAVSFLTVKGLPHSGKFVMPLDKAAEVLFTLGAAPDPRVSVMMLSPEQMVLGAQVIDAATTLYPEYHLMLEGNAVPLKGAVYDSGTLMWVLEHLAPVSAGAVAIQYREHSPTTIRPKLREGYECLRDVVLAIRPLTVLS